MDTPTGTAVRTWMPPQFDVGAAGYPAPTGSDPDPLDIRVQWALGDVLSITGRTLDDILTAPDIALAQQAITIKVMIAVLGGTAAALKIMAAPWLKSFTAGSYSETRFTPAELAGVSGRGTEAIGSLGPEPLASILLQLCTPERLEYWLYLITGRAAPAASFTSSDFGGCDEFPVMGFGAAIETWPVGPWW